MVGVARKAVTLPASGVKVEVPIKGFSVVVELSPDNTPADVPIIRVGGQNGPELPAYTGSQYVFPEGFQRLFVEGTAATGTLYLLVVNSKGLKISFPGTVTA